MRRLRGRRAESRRPRRTATRRATLRREGEYWTVGYEEQAFRLKDAVGLHYLRHLLRHPGAEVHVLDLVAAVRGVAAASGVRRPREQPEGTGRAEPRDLGPVLDARARAAYERRIAELRDDVDEAERWGDLGRASRAQEELGILAAELGRAVGLGGRDRPTGSSAERARIAVTKRINASVHKIADHSPALGRYLSERIRTGVFCSYTPDPDHPVHWAL